MKKEEDTCKETRPLLSPYMDGEMEENERARVEEHLSQCPYCREYIEDLRGISSILGNVERVPAPRDLAVEVEERLLAVGRRTGRLPLRYLVPAFSLTVTVFVAFMIYRDYRSPSLLEEEREFIDMRDGFRERGAIEAGKVKTSEPEVLRRRAGEDDVAPAPFEEPPSWEERAVSKPTALKGGRKAKVSSMVSPATKGETEAKMDEALVSPKESTPGPPPSLEEEGKATLLAREESPISGTGGKMESGLPLAEKASLPAVTSRAGRASPAMAPPPPDSATLPEAEPEREDLFRLMGRGKGPADLDRAEMPGAKGGVDARVEKIYSFSDCSSLTPFSPVIRSRKEFEKAWNAVSPDSPPPSVDFSEKAVVLLFGTVDAPYPRIKGVEVSEAGTIIWHSRGERIEKPAPSCTFNITPLLIEPVKFEPGLKEGEGKEGGR